jgi:CheY-like chemotaxis protein
MSLVGNLEDLGLGEILQIVSLSRKSGDLSLQGKGREARIIFQNGQVIRASSSSFHQNLGEVLVQKGVIDLTTLKRALSIQADEGFTQLLGAIIVDRFGVSADAIEKVVREQTENVVYSLFAWAEGTFEFELQESAEEQTTRQDPVQFNLKQGLNPQYLAMEGSRMIDEQRYREECGEAPDDGSAGAEDVDFDFDLLQEPVEEEVAGAPIEVEEVTAADLDWTQGAPAAEPAAAVAAAAEALPEPSADLVLVDDDPLVLEAIAPVLTRHGYRVHAIPRSEDALIKVDTLFRDGVNATVVVDLIMPRMDGTGILGGLELMELVRNNFPELPVLAVTDFPNEDAERRTRAMGVPLFLKPGKDELDEALESFGPELCRLLAALKPAGAMTVAGVNLGEELRLEMGEEPAVMVHHAPQSTGISQLRGMLEELNNPHLGGGIILLVLRFAAEFMNRAVVMLVKKESIEGLGQFGLEDRDGSADARVRTLRIPRSEASLFTPVLESRFPLKGSVDDSHWSRFFLDQLGPERPAEVFAGPIVSEGKVVAVLYGDNLPEQRPIGDTDSLEIFLGQAGIAMEKALLQRRLQDQGRGEA